MKVDPGLICVSLYNVRGISARGEIESLHPGYLGARDTYYVGPRGVGRISRPSSIPINRDELNIHIKYFRIAEYIGRVRTGVKIIHMISAACPDETGHKMS